MGLIKLALIGGVGYFAGKKVAEHKQNMGQSQDPSQYNRQWGRCSRRQQQQPEEQQQQQQQQQEKQQQPQQHEKHRQHPYQPDYYNTNSVRSAEDDMYAAPTEKRQLPSLPPYQDYNRLPHEKTLQLNFVEPQQGGMYARQHVDGPGALDRM